MEFPPKNGRQQYANANPRPAINHAAPCAIRAERKRTTSGGFSLVEVILAMGIASFSLLVIFSLIPTGLTTLHDATRQIVETEIFNKIGAELAATPFLSGTSPAYTGGSNDNLSTYVDPASPSPRFPAYFDYEGNELTGNAASKSAVYVVRCALLPAAAAPAGSISISSRPPTGELRGATVAIGFHLDPNPSGKSNPSGETNWARAKRRTFLLVNKGN